MDFHEALQVGALGPDIDQYIAFGERIVQTIRSNPRLAAWDVGHMAFSLSQARKSRLLLQREIDEAERLVSEVADAEAIGVVAEAQP